jgi:hypothetical protein
LNIKDDLGRWRASSRRGTNQATEQATEEPEIIVIRNTDGAAPNISLNSHNQVGRGELRAVTVIGTITQLGVLLYSGLATYYPAWQFPKNDLSIASYAFHCAATGTLVLVGGMLICAHVVESSTLEE